MSSTQVLCHIVLFPNRMMWSCSYWIATAQYKIVHLILFLYQSIANAGIQHRERKESATISLHQVVGIHGSGAGELHIQFRKAIN